MSAGSISTDPQEVKAKLAQQNLELFAVVIRATSQQDREDGNAHHQSVIKFAGASRQCY